VETNMRDDVKISEIEEKHDGQWVVVEVTRFDKYQNPLRGRLLFHGTDKAKIYREGREYREVHPQVTLYSFYAGDPIPQGMGMMLVQS
jgi:hypothetical protein